MRRLLGARVAILLAIVPGGPLVSLAQPPPSGSPCPELPGEPSAWRQQERWAWRRICAGRVADLHEFGGGNDTERVADWPPERDLGAAFLEVVLGRDPFRGAIPHQGVQIAGARFREEIDLSRVRLEHDLMIRDSRFEGRLKLSGVEATTLLLGRNRFLGGQDGEAINLVGAQARAINLDGARVARHMNMDSLRAGTLSMCGLSARSIWLATARIETLARLNDSTVAGPLVMTNAEIGTDLQILNSSLADVDLRSARIGRELALEGPRRQGGSRCGGPNPVPRSNVSPQSVDLTGATAGSLVLGSLCYGPVDGPGNWGKGGALILTNASVHTLSDGLCRDDASACTVNTWPDRLELTGFTYEQLAAFDARKDEEGREVDMAARPAAWWTGWLGRQEGYSPQPYDHLAATLAKLGHADTAKDVLYEGRNREAGARRFPANLFLWLSRVFIGYGYRLYYAAGWALAFVVLGALMLRASGQGARNGMPYGIAFSFDMLLPVIRLRDLHYEVDLEGWVRYYFYCHKLMGYLLASFLLAALSGLTK